MPRWRAYAGCERSAALPDTTADHYCDIWQYQMAPLAAHARCIAYDKRGHGRSDDPGSGYDYDTFADDLAALLDRMDLKDVVLVGRKASTRTQKGATQATDLARKPAGRNNTARTGGGGATKAEDLKIISWGIGLP